MNKILYICLFSLIGQWAHAQDYELFHKYWKYKERFYNKFIRIDWGGDGIGTYVDLNEPSSSSLYTKRGLYSKAGFSIPGDGIATWIDNDSTYGLKWPLNECLQPKSVRASNTVLNSGGNDIIQVLGYGGDVQFRFGTYLGVLATEYKLLLDNNQSQRASKTLEELYLALQAIRRLDLTANRWLDEQTCASNSPAEYTGYTGLMLREDVPYDFWEEYHSNSQTVTNNPPFEAIGGVSGHQIACGRDNLQATNHDFDLRDAYATLSQDQIAGLLFGLRFITRLVPDNTYFNGTNIKHVAGDIARHLLDKISIVRNLYIPKVKNNCGPFNLPDSVGGNADAFYMALAESAKLVCRESGKYPNYTPFLTTNDMFLWPSYIAGVYNFSSDVYGSNFGPNTIMAVIGAVTSNYGFIGDINTFSKSKMGHAAPFFPITTAIFRGLGPSSIDNFENQLHRELRLAPCVGPSGPEDSFWNPPWQWTASMKWFRPWVSPAGDSYKDHGDYNGLDYMLAYNLYHLFYHPSSPYYDKDAPENGIETNLITYTDNSTYPDIQPITKNRGVAGLPQDCWLYSVNEHKYASTKPQYVISQAITSTSIILSNITTAETTTENCYYECMGCDPDPATGFPGTPIPTTIVNGGLVHKSTHHITLLSGFEAQAGSYYQAKIGSLECVTDSNDNRYLGYKNNSATDNKPIKKPNKEEESMSFENQLSIFPNPTSTQFTLQLQLQQAGELTASLYNLAGQEVKRLFSQQAVAAGHHTQQIEVTELPAGVYLLRVQTGQEVLTKELVIAR